MKKLFVLLLLFTQSMLGYAGSEIPLSPDSTVNDEWTKPHKIPMLLPQVTYEEGYLNILSPYDTEAEIIIRNVNGYIIYNAYVDLLTYIIYAIILPVEVDTDKYSIQLYINGHSYIGYF